MEYGLIRLLRSFSASYSIARSQQFKGHPISSLMRYDLVASLSSTGLFDSIKYSIHASVGKGGWAEIPWIAIFDNAETTTLHHGLFIIIVFTSDYSSIFVSLNHGSVTHFDRHSRKETNAYLRDVSDLIQCHLETDSMITGPIDLKATSSVGRFLQLGNIAAFHHVLDENLSDDILINDLTRLRTLYRYAMELENASVVHLAYPDNDI